MVIANVENYHKILSPDCREILFLLSERRRQKKIGAESGMKLLKKLKEKLNDVIPNRRRKKSYENAESDG